MIDVNRCTSCGDAECPPSCAGGPEAAVSGRGLDLQGLLPSVIPEARERKQAAPRRHGARIVMAALRLVPRIPSFAVVPGAHIAITLQPFPDHAVEQHV